MDVQSQIASKRAAAGQARKHADNLFGDYKIRPLIFAAELEIQADVLEGQLVAPSLPEAINSNVAAPPPKAA
jgi:hypothetical protein